MSFKNYVVGLFFISSMVSAAPSIPTELENVRIDEKLGNQVDLNLKFRDEAGKAVPLRSVVDGRKPTLLFLVYYSCPSLCNFFLNGALETLKKISLLPGKDFNILTVSIDPREAPELARRKKESYLTAFGRSDLGQTVEQGWRFWVHETESKTPVTHATGTLSSVEALADQVGFRYRYNKEDEQFAHAAAMMVLTPEGRVSRYLFGIQFLPRDLKFALMEASGNKIGNVVDRLLLFCYHYDPKAQKYGLFASNLMRGAAAVTVVIMGLFLVLSLMREGRRQKGLT